MSNKSDTKPPTMTDSCSTSVSFSTAFLESIPKLAIGNMYAWKTILKMYLKMNGIYDFIKSDLESPEDPSTRSPFDMRQAAALYAIHNTINLSNKSSIASIKSPKLGFNTLIDQHGSEGGVVTANTLSELFSSQYDASVGITSYLATIQDIHSKIQDLTAGNKDLQLSDQLFAILPVNSLPCIEFGPII